MDVKDYIMWDWVDWLFATFLATCVAVLLAVGGFAIASGLSTTNGTVVDKYYDDPDLVCSKGCVRTDECWTIVVDAEPWWNDGECVSESKYDSIEVGDYFVETD